MFTNNALTRWFFILLSALIITLILWNTYAFFNQLKDNERSKMQIWASAQRVFQQIDLENSSDNEIIIQILNSNTTTPMISYSHLDNSYNHRNIPERQIDTDAKRSQLIEQFISENKPIESRYQGELLSTIYYGNSPIINKLKYYPAALILIIFLFFSVLYFFYKTSKSAEQNRLWAGMAKETAHQIGTPLSSLVGWAEILKSENVNPSYILEIEKDIQRLETITERFSKIGSVPKLEERDLVKETQLAFDYLKSRSSKLITFQLEILDSPIMVRLNQQLFDWTIENMVKNGIDAMKGKGTITLTLEANAKNAYIRVTDTGKGIPKRNFSKIFMPGFTTKKRGWGLGLSLAKRIIEKYHNGKIRVLKSTPDVGTTMEIVLRKAR
ncbi:MAG: two-component sensor histidine kinase [Flavobacteriaceae bacterium]|nr:two-component sensor histidine kinase [Flavobacteriaceae bacterium]|tara:strand:+ start:101 stop:1252 length:1152 start_codon:yes stop_codon:yes gene_type:complete